ncbi:hypothetical protein QBC39DRAFT_19119, partial [Podospora conica]
QDLQLYKAHLSLTSSSFHSLPPQHSTVLHPKPPSSKPSNPTQPNRNHAAHHHLHPPRPRRDRPLGPHRRRCRRPHVHVHHPLGLLQDHQPGRLLLRQARRLRRPPRPPPGPTRLGPRLPPEPRLELRDQLQRLLLQRRTIDGERDYRPQCPDRLQPRELEPSGLEDWALAVRAGGDDDGMGIGGCAMDFVFWLLSVFSLNLCRVWGSKQTPELAGTSWLVISGGWPGLHTLLAK